MLSPSKFDSITGTERKIPSGALELDQKFRHLREECARTMTLIERLRASPLHRFASTNLDFDDRLAWSRR